MNALNAGGMLRSNVLASGQSPTETLAADTQSLDQLRAQAKQSPDKALKAAAQQFEAIFMNMMLKSMREATPQDGMFDSEQTKLFTGMLDQQFAQSMSSKGVGLAEMMVRQLSGNRVVLPSPIGETNKLSPANMSATSTPTVPSSGNVKSLQSDSNE